MDKTNEKRKKYLDVSTLYSVALIRQHFFMEKSPNKFLLSTSETYLTGHKPPSPACPCRSALRSDILWMYMTSFLGDMCIFSSTSGNRKFARSTKIGKEPVNKVLPQIPRIRCQNLRRVCCKRRTNYISAGNLKLMRACSQACRLSFGKRLSLALNFHRLESQAIAQQIYLVILRFVGTTALASRYALGSGKHETFVAITAFHATFLAN